MNMRPHRFPPLSQVAAGARGLAGSPAELQAACADGFQEGMDKGYREGYESGLRMGRQDGHIEGRNEGIEEGRQKALAHFDNLAQPVEAMLESLQQLRHDYQSALRQEVVELVAKVARQVIRCELALQPVQLLALVDETLGAMPATLDEVEVYLNPEELDRICELAPEKAQRWNLIADPRMEPGECRVKAGGHEADAGCKQRLAACIEQVSAQLLEMADQPEVEA
ncbi:MAG: fliH [Rhodocyclaceae bacterium]|nr:fliH [Rhodocyclaceae bacterium]